MVCLAFGAVLGLVSVSSSWDKSVDADSDLHSRRFEFTYRVKLTQPPADGKTVRLWIPYPHSDANQEVSDIRVEGSTQGSVYEEPVHGNLIYYVSQPVQERPVELTMRFRVLRRENIHRDFSRAVEGRELPPQVVPYLHSDALVPLNDQIRRQARSIAEGRTTTVAKARAIYDYALAHLKYDKSGQGWGHGDLLYVCDAKRGNCTDFHAFFIGFARALGIPARFSIGFPLPPDRGAGKIAGYHCWAEFYLDGYGWVPVDASEAWKHPEKKDYFFGGHDENRVQFTTGRDLVLRPKQQGPPLNYFVYPYAEVDGQPVKDVDYEFSFRDLEPGAAVTESTPSTK